MMLEFKPIEIEHADHDGRLVLSEGRLVAVLSRLSDAHAENAGRWFVECGFGPLVRCEENFADLDSVAEWIKKELAANRG